MKYLRLYSLFFSHCVIAPLSRCVCLHSLFSLRHGIIASPRLPFFFLFNASLHRCVSAFAFLLTSFYLLLPLLAFAQESSPSKRIYAHILIGDLRSASAEAEQAIQKNPADQELWVAYISALAKMGNEEAMMSAWKECSKRYPEASLQRDLLEKMAWSVLEKESEASSPILRAMAMLGAFYGQDAKGVSILSKHLHDTSSLVRGITVKLAGQMRDTPLCDGVLDVFSKEKVWSVRQEAIQAIGSMHIKSAKSKLTEIISDENTMAEEKSMAIQSLILMLDSTTREEVASLCASRRSGLRLLACNIVAYFNSRDYDDLVIGLLKDPSSDVRAVAVQVVGLLRISSFQNVSITQYISPLLSDQDPTVAISAAWAMTLVDSTVGQEALEKWLSHKEQKWRLLAAGALSACGKYGHSLMLKQFQTHSDLYVQMNLARALIAQQMEIEKACEILYKGVTMPSEYWEWRKVGVFTVLAPSSFDFKHGQEHNRDAENQIIHVEVLNQLALLKYPRAQEAVTLFLQQKSWGVTGVAVAVLLTEGNEAALDIVTELLQHPNDRIRIQAALVMALWGKDERAISTLEKAYSNATREYKEHILEGIGRVGAAHSIPFLVARLEDPFPSLRIIAACALLQCLYN